MIIVGYEIVVLYMYMSMPNLQTPLESVCSAELLCCLFDSQYSSNNVPRAVKKVIAWGDTPPTYLRS